MKVLYIITKSNFGGAQRYVFDLATNLPKEAFDVVVALGGEGTLKKKLDENGIKTISIPSLQRDINILKEIKVFFDLLKIYRSEKPDIIHLNSSKIGGLGAFAGLFYNSKTIFTAHGWAFNEERPYWQKFIIKFLHWVTIILSTKTISVSQNLINSLSGWPMISKKISVIHNGIDTINFVENAVARKILIQKNPLLQALSDKFWLGSLAELHKNKGLDVAIDTVSKISENKDFIFLILGEGEERKNLEKLIKEKGLETKVFLLGFVQNAGTLLKAFNAFILPSRTEALPYSLIEAGSARLPIIASRVGGIPEIIEDGKDGLLFKKENTEELENAIVKIIEKPNESEKLAQNIESKISNHFLIKNMLGETTKLYRYLLHPQSHS
jgi:glycosyltransferase involved in cell wall biosynthesis